MDGSASVTWPRSTRYDGALAEGRPRFMVTTKQLSPSNSHRSSRFAFASARSWPRCSSYSASAPEGAATSRRVSVVGQWVVSPQLQCHSPARVW